MNKSTILALGFAAALSACGGGSDDDNTPSVTAEVPGSASMSVDGFVGYLSALVKVGEDNTLTPVDVNNVTPPENDQAAPTDVN